MDVKELTIKFEGGQRYFKGRTAWALKSLIEAGERGVTPIDHPAPRWSAYIHLLRKEGLDVRTLWEPHKGAYPGQHGRYRLASHLEIIEEAYHGK